MTTTIICYAGLLQSQSIVDNIIHGCCITSSYTHTSMSHKHMHTHMHTQQLFGCCLGQPGWAGTRRNIHPLTPIMVINHPLSAFSIYYDPWHPPCSMYVPDNLFPQSVSKFSLVHLLTWHPPLHIPYISSSPIIVFFSQHIHKVLVSKHRPKATGSTVKKDLNIRDTVKLTRSSDDTWCTDTLFTLTSRGHIRHCSVKNPAIKITVTVSTTEYQRNNRI